MAGDQAKRRTNVAFIACPADAQDFTVNRRRRNFMRSVHNAIEAGADIVNISFSKAAFTNATANMPSVLTELTSIFDAAWISSVAQPAYSHRTVGSVMSFFLHSRVNLLTESIVDPEAGLPASLPSSLQANSPTSSLASSTGPHFRKLHTHSVISSQRILTRAHRCRESFIIQRRYAQLMHANPSTASIDTTILAHANDTSELPSSGIRKTTFSCHQYQSQAACWLRCKALAISTRWAR